VSSLYMREGRKRSAPLSFNNELESLYLNSGAVRVTKSLSVPSTGVLLR